MLSIFLFGIFCKAGMAQIEINENFDSGTPDGWVDTYTNSSTQACEGNSERDNLYSWSSTGNITTPNYPGISNETDLSFSFDYKIVNYNWSNPVDPTPAGWGSAEFQYSLDDGDTWTTALTINDDNHVVSNVCATMSGVIPGASLPEGSGIKLRISNTWVAGDYYFYVDNFSANQEVTSPPNCNAMLTSPADGETDANILNGLTWSAATGGVEGYWLTVGTTSGGNDVLDAVDVGNELTYDVALSAGTTYYVSIVPYNSFGNAVDCAEESFTTTILPECPSDTTEMNDCGNYDFDITWSEIANADGYYVTVGTTSGGTDIADSVDNAGSTSYGISEPMVNTTYYVTIVAYNSVGESEGCTETMLTTSETLCYCEPVFSSGCASGDQINDFEIPAVEFSHLDTGCSDGAYGDFSDMTISLFNNSSYDYNVSHGFSSQKVRIWIDFNQDYEFDDSEGSIELVAIDASTGSGANAVTNGTITIPESVMPGTYRMRVGNRYSSQPIPCNTSGYGEAHDYTVEILELTCVPAEVAAAAVPDCDSDQFYVDVVVTSFGDLIDLTDGTQTQTVSEGQPLYNFGPYPSGTEVTISAVHEVEDCDFVVGDYSYACPVPGQICETAIEISSLPYTTSDDTANYMDDYENGDSSCSSYYMNGDDVVYTFTPSEDGIYIASLTNIGSSYSGIHILDGCPGTSPNCIGFEGSSSTADRIVEVELTAGTTYYIVISTWATPQSTTYDFSLTQLACMPAEATVSVEEDCQYNQFFIVIDVTDMGDGSPAITDGVLTWGVSDLGEMQIGPFANGDSKTLTLLHGDDSDCNVELGTFVFNCPPDNDECDGAITMVQETDVLDADSATPVAGTILGATDSGVEAPTCDGWTGTPNDDVWYSFEALTTDMNITLDDAFDGVVELLEGTCGSLVHIACKDTGSDPEIQATGLIVGETYYVRVFAYSSSVPSNPTFELKIWSTESLSVNDFEETSNSFTYFPNPVNDKLSIRSQSSIESIVVINMLGQEVMNFMPNASSTDIDMTQLQTGAYFVKVSIGDSSEIVRIIKE